MRLLPIFLGFLLLMGTSSPALAASPKATALRQANGLTVFTPPEKFLAGNFVADEMNPAFIFGPVKSLRRFPQMPYDLAHRGGRQKSPGRARQLRASLPSIPSTWRKTARIKWSIMSSSTRAA